MKDIDDRLLANTFDPDDIKSRKSNKRREQEQLDEIRGKYKQYFMCQIQCWSEILDKYLTIIIFVKNFNLFARHISQCAMCMLAASTNFHVQRTLFSVNLLRFKK